MTVSAVYRTPGREPDPAIIPLPSWRALLRPLGKTAAVVVGVTILAGLWNALAPIVFGIDGRDSRFVPIVDQLQDALAASVLVVGPIALAILIARNVAPTWQGMRLRWRITYVASVLLGQLALGAAAAVAIFLAHDGFHLFEPVLKTQSISSDGRMAHVYTGGLFDCHHDVYVLSHSRSR